MTVLKTVLYGIGLFIAAVAAAVAGLVGLAATLALPALCAVVIYFLLFR